VTPEGGVEPAELASRIESAVPGVSARLRDQLAANDRDLFVGSGQVRNRRGPAELNRSRHIVQITPATCQV